MTTQSSTATAPRSLDGVPIASWTEIQATTGDLFGLMQCLPKASDTLGLDLRQVGIFCRNTPNGAKGEALWREFTKRRDASNAPTGYGFTNFMSEVLAEAGYPLTK